MSQGLLKRCTGCGEYTLQDTCPYCQGRLASARPAKYSPEDHYGKYRRRLKTLERKGRDGA